MGLRKRQNIGWGARWHNVDCYSRDSFPLFPKSSVFLQKSWGNWISCGEAAVSKLGWHRDIARLHQGQNSQEASCSPGVIRNLRNTQWTEFISHFDRLLTTKSRINPVQLYMLVAPLLITGNLHVFLVGIYNWILYGSNLPDISFMLCSPLHLSLSSLSPLSAREGTQ